MTTYALIPGAGGVAAYWHRVVPLLVSEGHEVIAVDLPGSDPREGIAEYAGRVIDAIGGRPGVTLVAQSLGGFTAAMVCARIEIARVIFVNAMIPVPGETAGEWGAHTGSSAARIAAAQRGGYSTEFDVPTYVLHDVPPDALVGVEERDQSERVFADACTFERWPADVRAIAGRDDRLFPVDFQRRVAKERLGVDVIVVPGGHLVALSHPRELAAALA